MPARKDSVEISSPIAQYLARRWRFSYGHRAERSDFTYTYNPIDSSSGRDSVHLCCIASSETRLTVGGTSIRGVPSGREIITSV